VVAARSDLELLVPSSDHRVALTGWTRRLIFGVLRGEHRGDRRQRLGDEDPGDGLQFAFKGK
jgi:hypothetical protein